MGNSTIDIAVWSWIPTETSADLSTVQKPIEPSLLLHTLGGLAAWHLPRQSRKSSRSTWRGSHQVGRNSCSAQVMLLNVSHSNIIEYIYIYPLIPLGTTCTSTSMRSDYVHQQTCSWIDKDMVRLTLKKNHPFCGWECNPHRRSCKTRKTQSYVAWNYDPENNMWHTLPYEMLATNQMQQMNLPKCETVCGIMFCYVSSGMSTNKHAFQRNSTNLWHIIAILDHIQ